jgi:V8-like Glu-specific endopeptidase
MGTWRRIGLLSCVAGLAIGCAEGADVSPEKIIDARIVGGWSAPDQRSAGKISITCGGAVGDCSGTLIGSRTVLTAAHCVSRPDLGVTPSACSFRFQGPDTAVIPVERIDVNPEWDGDPSHYWSEREFLDEGSRHDVAVLHLARTALGGYTEVLATAAPEIGDEVTIVGYGRTDPTNANSGGVIHAGHSTIVDVHPKTLEYSLYEGAAICAGDSGGPSFTLKNGERRVAGVHSIGDCSTSEDTRVDAHHGFIAAAAGDDLGCGGVDWEGYCDGNWALWCSSTGNLQTMNCSDHGLACGYGGDDLGYFCI